MKYSIKIINYKFKIQRNKSEDGFIALMSAIIIAAVLMVVVFSVSFSGFMTRFNILDDEYKTRSFSLAEAYADEAILELAKLWVVDPAFSGTSTITVSATDYYSYETVGTEYVIKAHSVVQKATTNIRVTIDKTTFTTTDREEVPSL
ncbi:MAG: hypothetical protein A3B91_02125 [Candidatus Yanofskybacteria bacterium RIFCSPHIGHO2_02_FULL_41_29]|uniref:Type 4 fimbrial biogenesis protein PilX N-terminal domain-containing protein n=1 Tax=Candidatus Yanofskybacteria bacterium RIFCSPHIGHO2_01_FULL_41_53 TaxID=1802663 RepID=A0A1F8EGM0_9BACT|nr:MAG: hypothetical protein A2650_05000 [Candidatus Yanofskybacteria bacterium RIFCSPHIGHO2_01_FULL_41_53]OGN12323.1 MAG: hypothetical protein A3B91_02125 [Candidatus Yanofskybacteria bacterium RIFCSPHIGHO2_02_FULL_41_29]OGN17718.1 MAG: hypothetical protein A3F48_00570 [Candidatus Yanofskybacteria bacterium RIFCSPHIGHO2_12_FULL_41_9]OGN22024.1 MAG: hypothetical protein A2916_04340 [Candidatus Yanofskybacteria bacterium RIFCSPLOWO2_01_FULL_41_67]OGN28914.1 MAG: hypothetical protein A3H54_02100 